MPRRKGGCQCGQVRYTASGEPLFAAHCQCKDCKKASGCGHVTAAAFKEGVVAFKGQTKSYMTKAESGASSVREFCPVCGGRIAFRSSNMPGMILLMAGSLDDPASITPQLAIYGKDHVAWDHFDPKLPMVPGMPEQR